MYDIVNSILADFLVATVSIDDDAGDLTISKIIALGTTMQDDGAAILRILRGEHTLVSSSQADAMEAEIKTIRLSLDATLDEVQLVGNTIKRKLARMPADRRGHAGRPAELLLKAVPHCAAEVRTQVQTIVASAARTAPLNFDETAGELWAALSR